jgi:hypothetical protein
MWYPYLILSVTDSSSPMYVKKDVQLVIIDAGVHKVFHEWGLKEYPSGYQMWIRKMVQFYDFVKRVVKDTWVVVPDYPSDYPDNPIPDNVERTIRNIQYALDNYRDVRWIIPIQGRPNSIQSVANTIKKLSELGLLKPSYVAVAPTCVTKSVYFLKRLAFTTRQLLKDKKIHMFGVVTKAWKDISKYVDSTDTITFNFYCLKYFGRRCTTLNEHVFGWLAFLDKLLRDGHITKEVYEKALKSIKANISIKEFESIIYLLESMKARRL